MPEDMLSYGLIPVHRRLPVISAVHQLSADMSDLTEPNAHPSVPASSPARSDEALWEIADKAHSAQDTGAAGCLDHRDRCSTSCSSYRRYKDVIKCAITRRRSRSLKPTLVTSAGAGGAAA
jgi:hypothetical protein